MKRGFKKLSLENITLDEEPYIQKTEIDKLLIIKRPLYGDGRGSFQEHFRIPDIEEAIGRKVKILQEATAISKPNVIRGIHAEPQDKIITPLSGHLFAVIVDLRPSSKTFKEWLMFEFNVSEGSPVSSLFIPQGLGNSLCVAGSEDVLYKYAVTETYDPKTAGLGVNLNDRELNIPWPVDDPIISERDRSLPQLSEFLEKYR